MRQNSNSVSDQMTFFFLLNNLRFNSRHKVLIILSLLAAFYTFRRKCKKNEHLEAQASNLFLLAKSSSVSLAQKFGLTNEQKLDDGQRNRLRWKTFLHFIFPSFFSKECATCTFLLSVLISRTLLSVWIASIHGSVVRALVDQDFTDFITRLSILSLYSFPAAFSNALIEYLEKRLAMQLREKVTFLFLTKYLQGKVFYQMCQVDLRIPHPESGLTQDIDVWSKHLAALFTTLTKPLLDIIVISRILFKVMGPLGPLLIVFWYTLSAILMKLASPDFAKISSMEQKLEAEYRACHSCIVNHAEEIAFYGGNLYEFGVLQSSFARLFRHLNKSMIKRLFFGTYDSLLVKYGAFIVGYGVVGLPVFGPYSTNYLKTTNDTSQITQDYVRHSSLLINLAKAIGKIVGSQKQIQSFLGITSLMMNFLNTLNDLHEGRLQTRILSDAQNFEEDSGFKERGLVIESPNIEFHHVPIVTPDGELLVDDVNFSTTRGENVFVFGPNGSGKSSLFRVLSGLWPLAGGELHRPHPSMIFYIPQRPYMPIGTLRDQLIYPDTYKVFLSKGGRDECLEVLLKNVQMSHLLVRFSQYRFDTVRYWKDELSGGEKQRLAIGRLCYHKPVFAILDEATSAVSSDVEGQLYRLSKSRGISLITISHRLSLLKYHDFILKFDGRGHCLFETTKSACQSNSIHQTQQQQPHDLVSISSCASISSQSGQSPRPKMNRRNQFDFFDEHKASPFGSRSASQQFLLLQQSFQNQQITDSMRVSSWTNQQFAKDTSIEYLSDHLWSREES